MTKPTENELFEQWYMGDNIKSSLKREPEGHHTYAPANIAWNVWKARAELADKEKAELQAQINELREALEKVIFHAEFREQDEDTARAVAIGQLIVIEELANEYLAKTAPQCLQEHDNEVIERCAIRGRLAQLENKVVDTEIRALKGKQNAI